MSRKERTESIGDTLCSVCHERTEIYAIGQCDHPICYRCSTRMRVLCNQMYCPICRGDLPQVVFLTEKKKYEDVNRRNCIPNRQCKVLFEDETVEDAYKVLLEFRCNICEKVPVFATFQLLHTHMKRIHTQFACELCVEHLKIFPFERKFYGRKELAMHKLNGDTDNTSYRGHPLCRFCDVRYMDKDELFGHLRKDHFFCHFCDVYNSNEYYNDYPALKEHFSKHHFLCEEGHCANPDTLFTHAFDSDIDLKAHKAAEHIGNKTKAEAKELRTIDLNFQYAPRRRGRDAGVVSAEDYEELSTAGRSNRRYVPPRRINDFQKDEGNRLAGQPPQTENNIVPPPRVPILEDDFPTLGGKVPPLSSASQKKIMKPETDFPSLPIQSKPSTFAVTSTGTNLVQTRAKDSLVQHAVVKHLSITTKDSSSTKGQQSSASVSTDASRPVPLASSQNSWRAPHLSSAEDFPVLSGQGKERVLGDGPNFVNLGAWSKKQKGNTSHNKSNHSSSERKQATPIVKAKSESLDKSLRDDGDFPSLGGASLKELVPSSWVEKKSKSQAGSSPLRNNKASSFVSTSQPLHSNGIKMDKDEELQSKKKKKKKKAKVNVQCNGDSQNGDSVTESLDSSDSKSVGLSTEMKNLEQNNDFQSVVSRLEHMSAVLPEKRSQAEESEKMTVNPSQILISSADVICVEGKENCIKQTSLKSKPFKDDDFPALQVIPPKAAPPPPGFKNVAVAPPPGLNKPPSWTSSPLGLTPGNKGVSIPMSVKLNMYAYVPPLNVGVRNQELFTKIKHNLILKDNAFEEFRSLSGDYRSSNISAQDYYSQCKMLFGKEKLADLLPELVALLPDILKQQELVLAYKQNESQEVIPLGLASCPTCHQLLKLDDYAAHLSAHVNLGSTTPSFSSVNITVPVVTY